ncbi:flavin reductase family protein [Candidatus Methanoperedens nitratireducens]|uniref:Flavoredoxin n=1 Tax=Candidatus Methanoperedens nitratireducens TaxID=1392998 RepID=A0A284VSR1_9EURY|nr:flavin reductase family protein [Candidatus Methanoperedens nitroreducens]SNQ62325.1 Flavoredoxin [Candidatus Methanoperedens nitroreducens]
MKKSLGAKTLVYPIPVWVVGTYDKERKPNVMTIAWGGICCSSPPCVAISLRKATYSYGNIVGRKAFTINVPSEKYVKEADYFGTVSGRDVNKFSESGLTSVESDLVDAPYVKEFPLVLECRLIHTIEIGLHTEFIGEIMDVKADETVLGKNGAIDVEKLKPVIFAPDIAGYYGVSKPIGKAFSIGKR